MARAITPRDVHALVNLVCKEATGQEPDIEVIDTSSFVSIGEKILATGVENTLNAISIVLAKTIIASRPYSSKFGIVEESNIDLYRTRARKLSFYSRFALPSGDWNTQLYTNLSDGFDNGQNFDSNDEPQSTKSMWVQNQPKVLEMNFCGLDTWEESNTVYEYQLKQAFTDESTFASFVAGILTEKGNDIEVQKEAIRRMALLNHIGAVYTMASTYPSMKINLTSAYNAKFGTSYTSEELRTTYLRSFVEFLVAEIKIVSRFMEYRSTNFHNPMTKSFNGVEHNILRHTSRENQRLLLYTPLLVDSESMVYSEVFNDKYLKLENYEPVDFWQSFNDPSRVKVIPAVPGSDSYEGTQVTGEEVDIPYVVGCIFDKDALLVTNVLERAYTTPIEARKGYMTTWWSFARNICSDLTENFVLFTMEDEDTPTPGGNFSATPNPATMNIDELGDGTVEVTLNNIPENAHDFLFIGALSSFIDGIEPSGDGTAVMTLTTSSIETGSTINDVLSVLDENNNVLASTPFTLNIVVPEG